MDYILYTTLVTTISWQTWKSYLSPCLEKRARKNLMIASNKGDVDGVKRVLRYWDFDTQDVLLTACRNSHVDLCLYLCGKNVEKLNLALSTACKHGKRELVDKLLDNGATGVNEALLVASEFGQVDVLEPLVKKGANPIKGMKVTTNPAILNKLSVLRSDYSISLLNDTMNIEKLMNMK